MSAESYRRLLIDRFAIDDGPLPDGGPLIPLGRHYELAAALKNELGYRLYVYVVASHRPAKGGEEGDPEHYEIAYGVRTVGPGTHLAQWRVQIAIDQEAQSLVPLFAGADWQEREQYDLVGVVFRDHPDLRRLMMPEEWEGHPLRKDYPIETGHAPWR